MDFKKLLLVLTVDAEQSILTDAVQLCKDFKSKLYVLYVIDPDRVSRLASLTHQKVKVVHKKTEEDGWKLLYLLEDEAVENGVWTSLHLEDGNMLEVTNRYIEGYEIDALLVMRKRESKQIFVSSSIPVIGL
jgi:hypothetical protein